MIIVSLAAFVVAAAPTYDPKVLSPRPGNPSDADRAILELAIKQCHLHEGAIYFVQYDVPKEPVIKMTRFLGDTEEQMKCALDHFPNEFGFRFGLEFEADPPK